MEKEERRGKERKGGRGGEEGKLRVGKDVSPGYSHGSAFQVDGFKHERKKTSKRVRTFLCIGHVLVQLQALVTELELRFFHFLSMPEEREQKSSRESRKRGSRRRMRARGKQRRTQKGNGGAYSFWGHNESQKTTTSGNHSCQYKARYKSRKSCQDSISAGRI